MTYGVSWSHSGVDGVAPEQVGVSEGGFHVHSLHLIFLVCKVVGSVDVVVWIF